MTSVTPGSPPQDTGHVLVVDDEERNRQLLNELLEVRGFRVTEAEDGQRALEQAAHCVPDVILLDLMMPGLDGFEVCRRLKSDPKTAHVPVLVITAASERKTRLMGIEAGANDFLTKPIDGADVILRVRNAVHVKRLFDRLEESHRTNLDLVERLRRFNEELDQKVREATAQLNYRLEVASALNQVTLAINSVMELQPLLEMIMEKSVEVTNAEASSLILLDEQQPGLVFEVATGEKGAILRKARLKPDQGIAGWVAKTGQPVLVPDAYADPRFNPEVDRLTKFRTRSIACVPLKTQDQIIGVVQVLNSKTKPAFDERDMEAFSAFAHHAALAIEGARLYEEVRRKAEELREALERERWVTLQRDKLGKYVPKSVVQEIERQREQALASPTRTVDCSILFSDIQGFTRMAETTPPAKLVDMLNRYHSAMNAVIEKHEGVLDKFIGDGIMAVFLVQSEGDNHALRAVRCGIDMHREIDRLRAEWVAEGLGPLAVRIGINSGEVISGSIGAETRMDYTVVGDNVNVAARLESNARTGEVLISENVFSRVRGIVVAVELDPIVVKNRVQPVQPYSVRVRAEPDERSTRGDV